MSTPARLTTQRRSGTVGRTERKARQRAATRLHHAREAESHLRSRRARRNATITSIITITAVVAAVIVVVAGSLAGVGGGVGADGGAGQAAGPASRVALTTLTRQPAVSAVAYGQGSAWLTDDVNDTLVRLDPATGRSVGPALPLPGRPAAVTTTPGRVWVASMVTDTVEEVSDTGALAGPILHDVPVPGGPVGLATGYGLVWVASVIAGDVTAVDPATGRVEASAHLPGGAVRVATGDGGVWVTGSTDTLAEINPHPVSGRLRWRTFTVGQVPIGVVAGDHAVWVADAGSGTVSELDPVTGQVEATYRSGPDPVAVALVAGAGHGTVVVADGREDDVRAVGTGAGPGGVGPAARLGGTPRQLMTVGGAVWAAVGNPGEVVIVRSG